MKDRLILLIGASGSGKTAVAKELEKEGYNIIQSYTTREKRRTEEWGHIFVDVDELRATPVGDMIAYQQVYSGVHYWATREQYEGLGDSIYIVCPDGAREVQETLKNDDVEIITIYLQVDRDVRWHRMLYDRVQSEIYSRLSADDEKFNIVKCDYTVDGNKELIEVVRNIRKILKGDE